MGVQWGSTSTIYNVKKACDSVRRKALYNIFTEFRLPMKLVRPIKMCLNKLYIKDNIDKHLYDALPIQNALKQGDALSPLLFNFDSEHEIRKVHENREGLKLNGTHRLLVYADDINFSRKTLKLLRY
jgi:hypothetical protein